MSVSGDYLEPRAGGDPLEGSVEREQEKPKVKAVNTQNPGEKDPMEETANELLSCLRI